MKSSAPNAGGNEAEGSRSEFWIKSSHVRILMVAAVIAIAIVAVLQRDRLTDVEHIVETVGYPGVFLLALSGSAAIVVPLPGTAAIFLGGVFLVPVFVGLVAGVAEAIGEITGYVIGYSGQGIVKKNRFYRRVELWLRRRGAVAILIFSVIPNPVFDLLGIAAGVLRYPLLKFLFYTWIGKTVKNTGLAYAGFFGTGWVKDLFNISVSAD